MTWNEPVLVKCDLPVSADDPRVAGIRRPKPDLEPFRGGFDLYDMPSDIDDLLRMAIARADQAFRVPIGGLVGQDQACGSDGDRFVSPGRADADHRFG